MELIVQELVVLPVIVTVALVMEAPNPTVLRVNMGQQAGTGINAFPVMVLARLVMDLRAINVGNALLDIIILAGRLNVSGDVLGLL